jgi:hypothetical protein
MHHLPDTGLLIQILIWWCEYRIFGRYSVRPDTAEMEGPRRGRTLSAAHQCCPQAIRHSRRERHPLSSSYLQIWLRLICWPCRMHLTRPRRVSHSVIEVITNHREPQTLEAVYILMPTTENIRRIARDFTPGNEKYSAAHIFFTDRM